MHKSANACRMDQAPRLEKLDEGWWMRYQRDLWEMGSGIEDGVKGLGVGGARTERDAVWERRWGHLGVRSINHGPQPREARYSYGEKEY